MHTKSARQSDRQKQRGITLVELMVAITLSFVVVLAATALFVSSQSSYLAQDGHSVVDDTGRYALENIARSLRQTAYEVLDRGEGSPYYLRYDMSANVTGLDNKSLKDDGSWGISKTDASVNGSDVLAMRFFGSGSVGNPDGTMVDCAGFPISEPATQNSSDQDRGWSIYYVAKGGDGVPELRCKRMADGGGGWSSYAIARGVESFQVLYAIDETNDSGDKYPGGDFKDQYIRDRIPEQYLNATQISAKDAGLAALTESEKNKKTAWKKVVAVKVAMLISGPEIAGAKKADKYYLFGKDYQNSASDVGTVIEEKSTSLMSNRSRKVFTATIQLRNRSEGAFAQ